MTVAELIEVLKSKPQSLPVLDQYENPITIVSVWDPEDGGSVVLTLRS